MSRRRAASLHRHGVDLTRDAAATVQAARDRDAADTRTRIAAEDAAEAARPRLTRDDLTEATHVRDRWGWHEVVRVNARTVTVATRYSWTERIGIDDVLEVRS